MLLKKLYRFNKWLFVFTLGWLLVFVVINVKWGMVASPVYQYGMFSSVHALSDTQSAYRLVIDNKVLDPSSLSFAERDVLYVSLARYESHAANNLKVYRSLSSFLPEITEKDKRYFNTITNAMFSNWYKEKVAAVTGEKVVQLEVYEDFFVWNNGKAQFIKSSKLPYFE